MLGGLAKSAKYHSAGNTLGMNALMEGQSVQQLIAKPSEG
jgi:hypothetical protein